MLYDKLSAKFPWVAHPGMMMVAAERLLKRTVFNGRGIPGEEDKSVWNELFMIWASAVVILSVGAWWLTVYHVGGEAVLGDQLSVVWLCWVAIAVFVLSQLILLMVTHHLLPRCHERVAFYRPWVGAETLSGREYALDRLCCMLVDERDLGPVWELGQPAGDELVPVHWFWGSQYEVNLHKWVHVHYSPGIEGSGRLWLRDGQGSSREFLLTYGAFAEQTLSVSQLSGQKLLHTAGVCHFWADLSGKAFLSMCQLQARCDQYSWRANFHARHLELLGLYLTDGRSTQRDKEIAKLLGQYWTDLQVRELTGANPPGTWEEWGLPAHPRRRRRGKRGGGGDQEAS